MVSLEAQPTQVTRQASSSWTFLTNYAHVLIVISRQPDIRVREIADQVGITERATHRILADLVGGGYLSRNRVGRENRYEIDHDVPLRHPLESMHTVGDLVELLVAERGAGVR